MHSHNYGKSHSTRPLNPKAPSWITQDPKEIEELIIKYAKDDLAASQIGIKLRDQHSIPLVKPIIKKTITRVLEENDLNPELPEDLNNIVMKAIGLQKHLKINKKDNRNSTFTRVNRGQSSPFISILQKNWSNSQNWKYKALVAQLE